jgi:lipopolysaccharide transport protein LptA
MSWQRQARLGIAVFVVVFIAVVAIAMRQRKNVAPKAPLPVRVDDRSLAETHGGGHWEQMTKDGKTSFILDFKSQAVYQDGRTVQQDVTVTLPDRGGRTIAITAKELENVAQEGKTVGVAHLTGDVHLKTSDGIAITADEASYDDAAGTMTIPGKVEFMRGRMTGTGVGATYDRNREVIWLNEQAQVHVAKDPTGEGAMEATAGSIGLARAEHYIKLTRSAHISAEGRLLDADDMTIFLTPDDERVQSLEMRANSRIRGGAGGPQAMSARDIDLTYAENGRSLQNAKLMENAVVQLPGEGRGPGKRVSGKTIDITMAPDGATVTNLNATENVQLDLPADRDIPAKKIRAAILMAGGGNQGLQNATFGGNVDYRETRAANAKKNLPAINRVAQSLKLTVNTTPGLGAIEQAEFSGNVKIKDGTDVAAEAPHAVYRIDKDTMDLSPGEGGEPGPSPHVTDTRVSVDARTINLTLGSRKLYAETRVRSSMVPTRKPAPARGAAPLPPAQPGARVPSMLNQDQPVNVTSNRLEYDGAVGHAIYSGNARLWQGDTLVDADTIIVDDKTGNLEARGNVKTEMQMDETDSKTGKKLTSTTRGSSDTFLYEDARRLATYTTAAHIVSKDRDVTGNRIELFMEADKNELQRAEAYGQVQVKEPGRTATGNRLTYTAATEEYFMTGTPVVVIQKQPNDCKQTTASSVKFRKAIDTVDAGGVGPIPLSTTPCKPGTT